MRRISQKTKQYLCDVGLLALFVLTEVIIIAFSVKWGMLMGWKAIIEMT